MTRGGVVLLAAVLLLTSCGGDGSEGSSDGGNDVIAEGKELYEANCATCHGPDLRGVSGTGPSFLSDIYAPGHHPDESFQSAVENGVQPHHWDFGAMPPIPALDVDDVTAITAYIRSIQEEVGIIP
jgi:mono/diheme cytochrome c family protein